MVVIKNILRESLDSLLTMSDVSFKGYFIYTSVIEERSMSIFKPKMDVHISSLQLLAILSAKISKKYYKAGTSCGVV